MSIFYAPANAAFPLKLHFFASSTFYGLSMTDRSSFLLGPRFHSIRFRASLQTTCGGREAQISGWIEGRNEMHRQSRGAITENKGGLSIPWCAEWARSGAFGLLSWSVEHERETMVDDFVWIALYRSINNVWRTSSGHAFKTVSAILRV